MSDHDHQQRASIPIDTELVNDLQRRATELSQSFAKAVENLQQQMTQMANSTAEASLAYTLSAEAYADEIEKCTKNTLRLITECDELDKDFVQLQTLAKEIKAINKALDQLQSAIR